MKVAQCIAGAVPAQGYKPPNAAASEYQTIPMNKIEDFGVHANQYYPLDVSFFKSSLDSHMLDMLWNKCALQTQKRAPAVCPVIVDAGHCCATIALSSICIQHWHACKPEPRCLTHAASLCTVPAATHGEKHLMQCTTHCRYWVNTLAASPLINTWELTAGQISDIGASCPGTYCAIMKAGSLTCLHRFPSIKPHAICNV